MRFNEEEIENLEKIYRINLINSCSGYKAANLIGTVSENNNNLAIFSSLVHLGSNPPLLGFFLRPTEIVPRHTYLNIKENQYYTCLLYTSPSPRDATLSRMPSSA